jgi:hypothetical protein
VDSSSRRPVPPDTLPISLDSRPLDGRIISMATEKVSITLDPAIAAEARRIAGERSGSLLAAMTAWAGKRQPVPGVDRTDMLGTDR